MRPDNTVDLGSIERLRCELAETQAALSASRTQARALAHDARNVLQMAASLVSMQRRGKPSQIAEELDAVDRRFRALASTFVDLHLQSDIRMDMIHSMRRLGDVVQMQQGPDVTIDVDEGPCSVAWRSGARLMLATTEAVSWLLSRPGAELDGVMLELRGSNQDWTILAAANRHANEVMVDGCSSAAAARIRSIVPAEVSVSPCLSGRQVGLELSWTGL